MRDHKLDTKTKDFRRILRGIPKTEIHLHLEGLASIDSIWTLREKYNIVSPDIKTKEDLKRKFNIKTLNEFIYLFINVIQNCFKKVEDLEFLISDTGEYLKRNGIFYAEIFFAPTTFLKNGFVFDSIIETLDKGVKSIKDRDNVQIKFIIDVSRGFGPENAMRNLDLTLASRSSNIIGIGLGGAETQGPAKDYIEVFKKARENNLNVVAHAGEDVGPESIWSALKDLKVSRIGHGISAVRDGALLKYLANHSIPLEVCPTSNIFTRKYASSYKDHPIRTLFDNNITVTLNSDDPTIFGAELLDEYMNLIDNNIFTIPEIEQLLKNNLYATFLPEDIKSKHWEIMEKKIKELL